VIQTTYRRRQVNPKAVVILLAAVAILGVGGYFLHSFQVKRNAGALLEQAMLMEEKNPGKAREAYAFYVRLVPTDANALEKYGQLLLKESKEGKSARDTLNAFFILERALRLDSSRSGLHRQLAELAIAFRRNEDAKVHLDAMEAANKNDPALPRLRAHWHLVRGKEDDLKNAEEYYKQAIQAEPKQVEAYQEYARLLRMRSDPKKADEQMKKADAQMKMIIDADPRSAEARIAATRYYIGATRYYLDFKQPDLAEEHIRVALDELKASDASAFYLGAESARTKTKPDLDLARARLQRGLQQHPKELRLSQLLAQMTAGAGDVEKAKEILGPAFATLPENPDQLSSLGNSAADLRDTLRVEKVLDKLKELHFDSDPRTELLQARVYELKGQWGEARNTLERLTARIPSGSASARVVDLHLADCYRHLRNPAQCVIVCKRFLKDADPESFVVPRVQQLLAVSLQDVGDVDGAIGVYRSLVRRLPELQPELVRLLLNKALTQPEASRDWPAIDSALAELAKLKNAGAQVDVLRAQVLLAQGKAAQAAEICDTLKKRDPKQVEAWKLLFQARQQAGRAKEVPALIDDAERAVGPRADWPLARARHALENDRTNAAGRLAALETVSLPAPEQARLLLGLGQIYAMLGDVASTERVWRQYAAKDPANLSVLMLLVEAQLSLGKVPELDSTVKLLLENDQDGALTAYATAALEYLHASASSTPSEKEAAIARARSQLAKAAGLRPAWARIPALEGRFDELEGQKDRAIEHYHAAIDQGERGPQTLRRILNLYFDLHRYAEANALLARLPQQALATPDMARLGAHFALAAAGETPTQNPQAQEHAFELAQKAVSKDSTDYRDFVWLGQAADLAGRPADAETAYEKAVKLAPKNPEPWAALLFSLARSKPAAVEAKIAEAQEALPKEELPFALGPCYESMGKLDQARTQYLAALALRPDDARLVAQLARFYVHFNRTPEAEPLLRKLVEGKLKDADKQLHWARRHLALAVAAHGGAHSYQEAEDLLAENARTGYAAVEDKQAKAIILAAQPSKRRQAIDLLESLAANRATLSVDLGLTLARLYEADGNWPEARTHMLTVLTANPKNPTLIALYIQALLRRDEGRQAREWVDKLAALEPGSLTLLELQAQVLASEKKFDDAALLLKNYADRKEARLDRAAALLEQIGRPVEAESAYRTLVQRSSRPEAQILLAGFLARQKRLAESLAVLEAAWKTCKPDAVAQASVAAVRAAGSPPDEAMQRVATWINIAMAKHPNLTALPVCLAELEELRHNIPEAIRLYREIVRRDPNNVLALNNLAYYVALHEEGKGEEALAYISAAINLVGPDGELLDTKAIVCLCMNNTEQAIQDLQAAIAQSPSPGRYLHLAIAQQMARSSDAVAAYRKAGKSAKINPLEERRFQDAFQELRQLQRG
jgi:tetratricopeptide (TPR) repeat protein